MRAVARGMCLKSLPLCPERCGGPSADLAQLDEEARRQRIRMGCDAAIPDGERFYYAIRCPRCHGEASSGSACEVCAGSDFPGFKPMRRCPASYATPDVTAALSAYSHYRDGFLPVEGGIGDQSPTFLEFVRVFKTEAEEAMEEQNREG